MRSTGSDVAARAAARCSGAPWKYGSSVSTERHVAPPLAYARASDGGSKSARMRPFDGLAFFTSAISAGSPRAMVFCSAARNPRGGEAAAARAFTSTSGRRAFAAAISSRFVASILARISVISPSTVRDFDQPLQPVQRRALVNQSGGNRDASGKVRRLFRHDQRASRIEE